MSRRVVKLELTETQARSALGAVQHLRQGYHLDHPEIPEDCPCDWCVIHKRLRSALSGGNGDDASKIRKLADEIDPFKREEQDDAN